MQPEKNRMNEKFQPGRCQIDDNIDERKYNKPASSFLTKVEKIDENPRENRDCAHSKNMNVGEFQSKDKFFGLVKGRTLLSSGESENKSPRKSVWFSNLP